MISDITIGQYYSGTSVIHRMDARMKFVLTMALIVILLCAGISIPWRSALSLLWLLCCSQGCR